MTPVQPTVPGEEPGHGGLGGGVWGCRASEDKNELAGEAGWPRSSPRGPVLDRERAESSRKASRAPATLRKQRRCWPWTLKPEGVTEVARGPVAR